MSHDEQEDKTIYKVVLNHEEQYSIWPADRENALGWNDAGKTGTKGWTRKYTTGSVTAVPDDDDDEDVEKKPSKKIASRKLKP